VVHDLMGKLSQSMMMPYVRTGGSFPPGQLAAGEHNYPNPEYRYLIDMTMRQNQMATHSNFIRRRENRQHINLQVI
jgi:hypothetical protein